MWKVYDDPQMVHDTTAKVLNSYDKPLVRTNRENKSLLPINRAVLLLLFTDMSG